MSSLDVQRLVVSKRLYVPLVLNVVVRTGVEVLSSLFPLVAINALAGQLISAVLLVDVGGILQNPV